MHVGLDGGGGGTARESRALHFSLSLQLLFHLQCTHGTDIHADFAGITFFIIYPYPCPHQLNCIGGTDRDACTTVSTFISIYFYHRASSSLNIWPSNVLTSVSSSSHASCGKPAFQHVWQRNSSADQLYSVAT